MNRYANKSEVMLSLERGGHIESHDLFHWLVKPDGETARLRYSLWGILTGRNAAIVKIRKEMRPPSRLPYFIYALREQGSGIRASQAPSDNGENKNNPAPAAHE